MKTNKLILGNLQTNCYVLSNDGAAVVVDIPYNCGAQVDELLQKEKLKPVAVLLTHGHFDHCGGADSFARAHGIPVYAHKKDLLLCNAAKLQVPGYDTYTDNCNPTDLFEGEEGEINVEGFVFYMTNTPGHTPGSCVYFTDGIMLSGDTLFRGSIGRTDFAFGSPHDMQRSLKKLKGVQGNYIVYPGHGDRTTLDEEKLHNFYFR